MISSELAEMRAQAGAARSPPELIAFGQRCEAVIENVSVIISCCAHQRRIIDDILTLSKLDSKLLAIAPSLTDLNHMLNELEKMFEADAQKFDVTLRLEKDLGQTQWAMLDTGRLTQVLTNLITNATKFTQKEAKRKVTIKVGVSRKPPSERDLDVEWVPAGIARERTHAGTGTGTDDEIYLHFTVSDTGCGFDEEQKSRIFERFSQASPRTHSKYGGSGLGLFISREMIELQGGEIGVSSRPGHGATFAFYIAARSAEPPQKQLPSRALLSRKQSVNNNAHSNKFSILVVEDNRDIAANLGDYLEERGHTVDYAADGVTGRAWGRRGARRRVRRS